MKFSEYPYQRIDLRQLNKEVEKVLKTLRGAKDGQTQIKAIMQMNSLKRKWTTYKNIASTNFHIDTKNVIFKEEQVYWNNISPELEEFESNFSEEILKSKFKNEISNELGPQYLKLLGLKKRIITEQIKELRRHESSLVDSFMNLQSSAKIVFQGEKHNLSSLRPYMLSNDREIRKLAFEATYLFYQENEDIFDNYFDDLVTTRHKIAIGSGYNNYIPLAYVERERVGYDSSHVAKFRNQILQDVVPLCVKLQEQKRKYFEYESLNVYDTILFKDGDAKILGNSKELIKSAEKMYHELSKETGSFFSTLRESELMDLEVREGKSGRGFCTDFPLFESQFIFANFTGTANDVTVLTHEFGHAFQAYQSRKEPLLEYLFPTTEACEIHSHTMEYLTGKWMNQFFGEMANRYRYKQVWGDLCFLPLCAQIDHFQEIIYSQPKLTPTARKQEWLKLQKMYQPWIQYDGIEFLESGGYWQGVSHIWRTPFYYIDYALALTCAFQFWSKSKDNWERTWGDYLNLCKLGGSKSFLDLVSSSNLKSPFEDGTFQQVISTVDNWLEKNRPE